MGKDKRESALEKGEPSPVEVPSFMLHRDEWTNDATAYRLALAARDSDSLDWFIQERHEIEVTICERESVFRTKGGTISEEDAKALATRIRELHLSRAFDGSEDNRAFLIGRCLKLKEGNPAGDVFTAFASLEAADPPPAFSKWRGGWFPIKLAVPAELNGAFGVQSSAWLYHRSEDFLRDYLRKGFPPGSHASRLFDGGSFFFSPDHARSSSHPEPNSIPVVPAPDEDTIAQYIEEAPTSHDHWGALLKAAAMLHRNKQTVGDALQGWLIEAAGKETRPKRTERVQRNKNALRNFAIVEAIRALVRCGMKVATSDREPGSACVACAGVFALAPATVSNIWKERNRPRA